MGSSGGGGSSGAVSHSAYLETVHGSWLNATGVDTIEKSMTEVMDSSLGSSPWAGLTAYDPTAPLAANVVAVGDFATMLGTLGSTPDEWLVLYETIYTLLIGIGEEEITASVDAFSDVLDDEIDTKVLPRFRRGMQDINAVVSSSFAIGESVIEGFRDRDVAKFMSALRITVGERQLKMMDQIIQAFTNIVNWSADYVRLAVESNRIKIVALKEQTDQNGIINDSDAKWDLEVFQYGANLLGSIGGGTAMPNLAKKNQVASVLGGAMSGAAGGAMIGAEMGAGGGPWGAGIGAVLGAAFGFLS